ncbi:MAG: hypothetical protein QXZ44_03450 [Ferroplasma sp.]
MSLSVKTLIRISDQKIENAEASKVYLKVPKKLLNMYDIKLGCIMNGEIEEVRRLLNEESDNIPEIRTDAKNYSQFVGTKLRMFFLSGKDDSDYLFFTRQFSARLTSYAIFPNDYIIKIKFNMVACGWKHIKLYSETSVNFDDTVQYYE